MAVRQLSVLHVEDDEMQRRLIAAHLSKLNDFAFDVTAVDSEDQAVEAFGRLRHGLVILDYQLTQGNGLNCLQRLRAEDRIVPIVAVSGAASPRVAADLIKAGADDYLSKDSLTTEIFEQSVRAALIRADAWKARVGTAGLGFEAAEKQFQSLCQRFLESTPWLAQQLDEFTELARGANLGTNAMERLFDLVCGVDGEAAQRRQQLRPVLLEMLFRLHGHSDAAPTTE